jgi:hypothetical protein
MAQTTSFRSSAKPVRSAAAKGLQWYWKADFVRKLSEAVIEEHLERTLKAPSKLSIMHYLNSSPKRSRELFQIGWAVNYALLYLEYSECPCRTGLPGSERPSGKICRSGIETSSTLPQMETGCLINLHSHPNTERSRPSLCGRPVFTSRQNSVTSLTNSSWLVDSSLHS